MRIEPDLERLIRRIAGDQNRTADAVMADAVRDYAERANARSTFVAEAGTAWDDYRTTGLHVTAAELDDWLGTWGAAADKTPPKCHG